MENQFSRRGFVAGTAALVGSGAVVSQAKEKESGVSVLSDVPGEDYKIQNGRIQHSVMGWCFNPMPTETLIKACAKMGMPAMEGISRKHYPLVKELGMQVSIVGSHGFKKGPCNRDNHEECITKMKEGIDLAAENSWKNVITFTGMHYKGLTEKAGMQNSVDCWQQVIPYAEKKGVTLCLEHLNSRDDSHPMKGHPGYFGDDVDLCVDLIRKVGSANMKLLFDVYHVQIMNGDVISRINQYKDVIGHYHTAGVPGRAEIDDTQEVFYPAVMKAILKTGYKGYVAHEFIPTWEDKLSALRHGVRVCDV